MNADAADHVAIWRGVYDHLYRGEWGPLGEDFDGWDSTYDGSPIPETNMRAWRDSTAARVLDLAPRRVAEIGVGGGLLMMALLPRVEHYTGTDLSPVAVEVLGGLLARERPDLADRVELVAAAAHEDVPLRAGGPVDVVVLNSVVQYFPDLGYLADVVAIAADLAGPAGAVFVGDVRNAALREHFARAVARAHGAGATELEEATAAVMARDHELLVDPGWWAATAGRLGLRVQIRCKEGLDDELTRYRYDVVLCGPERPVVDAADARRLPFAALGRAGPLDGVLADAGGLLRVVGVPNRRLTGHGPDPDRPVEVPDASRFVVTWSTERVDALDVVLVADARGSGQVVTQR